MPIRVEALGGLAVVKDGRDLPELASLRSRLALLVYLTVEGRTRRDTVLSLFWPESDTPNARHALRQAIYQLNRIVDEAWLETVGDELVVTSAVSCDVADFRHAAAGNAVEDVRAFYRGPFLDGVHLLDNSDWELWVDGQRSFLTGAFRRFCRDHIDRCVRTGEIGAAIEGARLWVECNPFDDEGQHGLIELLVASGNHLGALSQYDAYVRLAQREGLSPHQDTIELIRGLRLSQDTTSDMSPARMPETHGGDGAGGEAGTDSAFRPGAVAPGAVPMMASDGTHGSDEAGARSPRRRSVWRRTTTSAVAVIGLGASGFLLTRLAPPDELETWFVVPPPRNETGDSTLDPLARIAADWISDGLVRTGLGPVRAGSDTTGSRSVRIVFIRGRYWHLADSLHVSLRVVESDRSSSTMVDAAGGIDDDPMLAVETARDRLLGLLSARREDRLTAVLGETAAPRYEAYVEFIAGLELYGRNDSRGAGAHFRRAVEIDPSFLAARLELANGSGYYAYGADAWPPMRAAFIRSLDSLRAHLTPAQQYHLVALQSGSDLAAIYRAYREAARLAPRRFLCEFADAALDIGEYQQVLDLVARADPNEHVCRLYWLLRLAPLHHLGRYADVLLVAKEGRTAGADPSNFRREERYALAALGRVEELRADLDAIRTEAGGEWRAPGQMLYNGRELALHGYTEAAQELFDYAVTLWEFAVAERGAPFQAPAAAAYLDAGDLDKAREQAQRCWDRSLEEESAGDWSCLVTLGEVAALEADTAETHRILGVLEAAAHTGHPQHARLLFERARITALLDERDRAVTLLRQALAEGMRHPLIRVNGGLALARLRGYAPFDALMKGSTF